MKSRVLWLAVVLSLSLAAWGQDSASITGTVTDQSGAAVPDAQVTVSSLDRGIVRPTTTNATGDYLVAGLPSGPVNVTVVASGFKRYEAKAIVLAGRPEGPRRRGAGSRRRPRKRSRSRAVT